MGVVREQVDIQSKIAVDLQVSSCLIIAMNQVKTYEKTLEPVLKSQNEYAAISALLMVIKIKRQNKANFVKFRPRLSQ